MDRLAHCQSCCSVSSRYPLLLPSRRFTRGLLRTDPRRLQLTQAEPEQRSNSVDDDEAERRLAALEAGVKKRKSAKLLQEAQLEQNPVPKASTQYAEWKEGKMFPEGWEQMDPSQKMVELYLGKRGFLYWATQSAWYSVLILGFLWVVFRFVGPNLGLYKLASDFTAPPPL